MAALNILALDLSALACGMAYGPSGAMPQTAVKAFRHKGESIDVSVRNVATWIRNVFEERAVDLVAIERYIPIAFRKERVWIRDEQIGMFYAVLSITECYAKSFVSDAPSTIRKHFCGRAYDADGTKDMVVHRARMLGYDVSGDKASSEAKADACAVFDWASSHFARSAPAFTLV
jgi:hypothetical protein